MLSCASPNLSLSLTEHKTSKHEAHQSGITEDLSADFMDILRSSLEHWPRDHLFVAADNKPFTTASFSKWFVRTTGKLFEGKAPGVSLLRHAWATSLDFNTITIAEREEVARQMGHSPAMQDCYRFLKLAK